MKKLAAVLSALIVVLWAAQTRADEESVVPGSEAAVTVVGAASEGNVISGTVLNNSDQLARDVQLLIRRTWLWNNERHPGANSPGQADFYTVPDPIPPHGNVRFRYQGPPLPERSDGHFTTKVEVLGFTQIGFSNSQQGFQR